MPFVDIEFTDVIHSIIECNVPKSDELSDLKVLKLNAVENPNPSLLGTKRFYNEMEDINKVSVNDIKRDIAGKILQSFGDNEKYPISQKSFTDRFYKPFKKSLLDLYGTTTVSALGLGEANGNGDVRVCDNRAYIYFNEDIINSISIKDGYLLYVYRITNGLDGEWTWIPSVSAWKSGFDNLDLVSSSYVGYGFKIRKADETSFTLQDLQDAITITSRDNIPLQFNDVKDDIDKINTEIIPEYIDDLTAKIEGNYSGNEYIHFLKGDFQNVETGEIIDDDTRGYVILPTVGIKKITAKDGFKIYCYSNNERKIQGFMQYTVKWTDSVDLTTFKYNFIIVKILKGDGYESLTKEELKTSVYLEKENTIDTIDNLNSILNGRIYVHFFRGDFQDLETVEIIDSTSIGWSIIDTKDIYRIVAPGGYKICGYSNNISTVNGCSYVYTWCNFIDLSECSFKYIIVKLRKEDESDLNDYELTHTVIIENNIHMNAVLIEKLSEYKQTLNFVTGDLIDAATGKTNNHSVRGIDAISTKELLKVVAKNGYKICCYGNNNMDFVNSSYTNPWSQEISFEGYPYAYTLIKVRKDNDTEVIDKNELSNCATAYFYQNNDYPHLVAEAMGYQLEIDNHYYSLDNKLPGGKKYMLSVKFEGFEDSDFIQSTGKFTIYNINKNAVINNIPLSRFNYNKGLDVNGENKIVFVCNSVDFYYIKINDAFSDSFAPGYDKKVYFKFYLLDNDKNIVTKQDVIQKENIGVNVFGDVLPPLFKDKLLSMSDDLLITCVGDSLTGAVDYSSEVPDPAHSAPGHQYNDWVTQLLEIINKNKPLYDRLDSIRDNVNVFEKQRNWNIADYYTFGSDDQDFGDFSQSAVTFRSADTNAQVKFTWDLDNYDKCNIVTTKSIDGVMSQIIVSEGNGKVLVSEDRTNWIEANGFQFLQRSNPDNKTNAQLSQAGEAKYERHRRLWMKKVNDATGTVTITYKRDNSTPYLDSYMYCWGIEKYSYPAIFIDNIGRGGRPTVLLQKNISDIFDRHPDLVIYEMPIANEQNTELSATLYRYNDYFTRDLPNSFKTKSNNYQDVPVLIVLPHCRAGYFDDNNSAIKFLRYGEPDTDLPSYYYAKRCYTNLKNALKDVENAKVINLLDYILDECIKNFGKINVALGGNVPYGYTVDSVHLTKYGAQKYVKYLAPIFYI